MANPYAPPTALTASTGRSGATLLRPSRPEVAAAVWFAGVSATHFVLFTAPAYLHGGAFDITPAFWLAVAISLYGRVGVVRRLVLLAGSFIIFGTSLSIINLLIERASGSSVTSGGGNGHVTWSDLLLLLLVCGVFLYPTIVLWPSHVSARFRDRLPPRRSRQDR